MKLNDFYTAILATANFSVTNDGCVSIGTGKQAIPMTIAGKRLVLPTRENLAADKTTVVVFHPLSEIITRGESDVLARFRQALSLSINATVGKVFESLLELAASVDDNKKLDPNQSMFLDYVKEADDKTVKAWASVMKKVPAEDAKDLFVSFYLKRNGTVGDKRYSRIGVVSFPLYEKLRDTKDKKVYGVTLSNKDREQLLGLYRYIFPHIDEEGYYNTGSDSKLAPFLDALMHVVIKVAAPINDQIDLFKDVFPEDKLPPEINCDWQPVFDNIDSMQVESRMVPPQAGNEGNSAKVEEEKARVANPLAVPPPKETVRVEEDAAPWQSPIAAPPRERKDVMTIEELAEVQRQNAQSQEQADYQRWRSERIQSASVNQGPRYNADGTVDFASVMPSSPQRSQWRDGGGSGAWGGGGFNRSPNQGRSTLSGGQGHSGGVAQPRMGHIGGHSRGGHRGGFGNL